MWPGRSAQLPSRSYWPSSNKDCENTPWLNHSEVSTFMVHRALQNHSKSFSNSSGMLQQVSSTRLMFQEWRWPAGQFLSPTRYIIQCANQRNGCMYRNSRQLTKCKPLGMAKQNAEFANMCVNTSHHPCRLRLNKCMISTHSADSSMAAPGIMASTALYSEPANHSLLSWI